MSDFEPVCPNRSLHESAEPKVLRHGKAPLRFKCAHCKKTWSPGRSELGFRRASDTVRRAQALYESGESLRGIARAVGVSLSTVQRWACLFDTLNSNQVKQ